MDERITSVILQSVDRPDIGSVNFALYTQAAYILERMDGWSGISSINTVADPYQIRNGSNVSRPNYIGGKIVSFLVHIHAQTETATLKVINRLNGILQTQMKLKVIDDGVEYSLIGSMVASSYNLDRKAPTLYTLEFAIVSESAYKVRSEVFSKVISGGGEVISGGIIYPTFSPRDDLVAYPDFDNAYNTITSIQQGKIVIDGNGDIYPRLYITGTFYSVKISHTDWSGNEKIIEAFAVGGVDVDSYHEWWIDTATLQAGFTTPNLSGSPNWNDSPILEQADWFKLSVGENTIEATFNSTGSGEVIAEWQERYL